MLDNQGTQKPCLQLCDRQIAACRSDMLSTWSTAYYLGCKQQGEDVSNEAAATAADTEVVENDIQYKVALRSGQKTGFYADQRDSRNLIRALADGKRVLDLCCYSGGFALSAAKGGASEVTGGVTTG